MMSMILWPNRRFKFKLFWLKLEGFKDAVREGWLRDATIMDAFLPLDNLFKILASHLQAWG
jgi:hypothetical protein